MVFDGSQVTLLIAFIGGIVTFFASCLLPLVPTYLAYLSGITTSSKSDKNKNIFKRELFLNGLFFTAGFIIIFVLLGATANTFGRALASNRLFIQKIGGALFIFLGILLTGKFLPVNLYKEFKFDINKSLTKWKKFNSLIVGFTFGFAWTPCIGPVLAVILFWASQAATLVQGTLLLLVYGIGLAVPFLFIALGFEKLAPKLQNAARFGKTLQIVAGIIIVISGILMILGRLDLISIYLIRTAGLTEHAI